VPRAPPIMGLALRSRWIVGVEIMVALHWVKWNARRRPAIDGEIPVVVVPPPTMHVRDVPEEQPQLYATRACLCRYRIGYALLVLNRVCSIACFLRGSLSCCKGESTLISMPIQKVLVGMRLARNVERPGTREFDAPLLTVGTVLTERHIDLLRMWGVKYVGLARNPKDDVVMDVVSQKAHERTIIKMGLEDRFTWVSSDPVLAQLKEAVELVLVKQATRADRG